MMTREKGGKYRMDIGFVITYLLCPIIVSVGLITGKRRGDDHQLLTAYAFKGNAAIFIRLRRI